MSDEGRQLFKSALAAVPIGMAGAGLVYFMLAPTLRIGGSLPLRMLLGLAILLAAGGFLVPVTTEKISGIAGQALWIPLLVGTGVLLASIIVFFEMGGVTVGMYPQMLATAGFVVGGIGGMAWVNAD